MSKSRPKLPIAPLRDLLAWFRTTKTKGLIIGGLAVAFLGRPRTTDDVDAIIFLHPDDWSNFLKAGKAFTFVPRIADPLGFAQQNRMFLLRHKKSRVEIDLSVGGMPFELEALQRAQEIKVGRLSVPVPTVEDLIVLKAVANRSQDKIDIQDLLDAYPDIDVVHIRKYADEFAMLLELPEIYQDLDRMLSAYTKKKQRKTK